MSPTKIGGRYLLQERLGEGGMGVVWRALDTRIGTYVAIKMIRDGSDVHALELFAREWKTLAEISHPNIVEVRDVDTFEENKQKKPFFVMPLLQGSTLGDLIAHGSAKLTVSRIVEIATQVCRGLQAAHQRGLVHRDLKPSNIFVMEDYTAKIIDFGVVYLAGGNSTTGQKGTYQYMSPEQVQMKEITPSSDVFSLGIVLYEALSLRKPFARNTAEETMQAVCKFNPPPVSEINPAVSDTVSRVIHKSLAKLPMHRFSSARELAEALNQANRGEVVFDRAKIQPRIERAKAALKSGDEVFASEILAEMEAEGHLDPDITVLRTQIDLAATRKKIRQLLESARARMEQDEIPLALEKLREVIELDPDNADALAMRQAMQNQRNERQVNRWLDLASTHLANRDFASARNAVQEVLAIRRTEPRALEMLERIDSTEEEAKRIRAQKEQLYNSALKAYQNDEIDTALSRLERLLSVARANPDAAIPERDAVYQTFYKEVRSERDTIRSAIEEAQRCFSDKNFVQALRLCQEGLKKHPGNSALQTLRIQIEDAERQHRSAYIAEISARLEKEFDLDRRVNIVREACDRYPDETHFAEQLKLVRDRRDLVASIVAKANQYEERSQFAEALSQWDMLRNIHPQYPGLSFDLERCKKERNRQVREEDRARAIEEIDRLLEGRSFTKALDCVQIALREFPEDEEIAGLGDFARQGLERLQQTRSLLENAQAALAEKNWSQSTELLRKAVSLDPRSPTLRHALVEALLEWARSELGNGWQSAEPLYEELRRLDPTHPGVAALKAALFDQKCQSAVGKYLTDARVLVSSGKTDSAVDLLKDARTEFPNDTRLEHYQLALLRQAKESDLLLDQPGSARPAENNKQPLSVNAGASSFQSGAASVQPAKSDDDAQFVPTKVLPIEGPRRKAKTLVEQPARAVVARLSRWRSFQKIALTISIVLVVFLASYLYHRVHARHDDGITIEGHVQLTTEPADAVITINSRTVSSGMITIPAGRSVAVEVARLGYRKKQIQLTAGPPQQITLDLEPVIISVELSQAGAGVELDGRKVVDVNNGAVRFEMTPDRNTHEIRIVQNEKSLLKAEFTALPGALPLVQQLDSPAYLAVSTLGDTGSLYSPGLTKVKIAGRELPDGIRKSIDLSGLSPGRNEIVYSSGKDEGRLTVASGNNPFLVLAPVRQDYLLLTSNVFSASLTIDGQPIKPTSSGWHIPKLAGIHHYVLSAEGYRTESWAMDPSRERKSTRGVNLVKLTSNAPTPGTSGVTPALARLLITAGTPGAEVILDGRKLAELDGKGNRQLEGVLESGPHSLALEKAGYQGRKIDFVANPPEDVNISGDQARLVALGALVLDSPITGLAIRYHRVGEPIRTSTAPGRLSLPAGKYEILIDGPGTTSYKTEVRPGETVSVPLHPALLIQDGQQVSSEGEWFKLKESGKFLYLRPGASKANFVFWKKPGPFTRHRMEWSVVNANRTVEVVYALDDQNLTRKQYSGGKSGSERTTVVNAASSAQKSCISVTVKVNGSHITVTNDKGAVLDDFSSSEDFSKGTLGVRTNTLFVVRN